MWLICNSSGTSLVAVAMVAAHHLFQNEGGPNVFITHACYTQMSEYKGQDDTMNKEQSSQIDSILGQDSTHQHLSSHLHPCSTEHPKHTLIGNCGGGVGGFDLWPQKSRLFFAFTASWINQLLSFGYKDFFSLSIHVTECLHFLLYKNQPVFKFRLTVTDFHS